MRTVSFKSVLYGAAARLGLQPYNESGIDKSKKYELVNALNDRVAEGWDWDWWPELMVCEQRTLSTAETTSVRYAPWVATGKTTIGTVKNVYRRHPLYSRAPDRLPHIINADGVVLNDLAPDDVWIMFRKRVPMFTAQDYASTTNYAVDDLCYYESKIYPAGECYICIQAGTGETPPSSTEYWTKIDFPAWLKSYVIQGVYADCLDDEDQETARWKAGQKAEELIIRTADTIMGQQSQTEVARVENG